MKIFSTFIVLVSLVFIGCSSNHSYDEGMKYYAEGDTSKAIEIFKGISVSNSSDKLYAKNVLGLIYTKQKLYDLAISEYKDILSLDSVNVQIHNNLGYTYSMKGEDGKAFSQFSKALEIDPCNPFAIINRKYPVREGGISLRAPLLVFDTKDKLAEYLITKLDKPFRSTNLVGAEDIYSTDFRDYAVWVLGSLKYKKSEEPLKLLLERNDYDPCLKRIIVWALENIKSAQ